MKRIIRLTESDLARIVRRVIKEQVEATTMAAETYYRIPKTGGGTLSMTNNGKDVMWTVTPSQSLNKDDKGKMVPIPGVLKLTIRPQGIGQTQLVLNIYCQDKKVEATSYVKGDYTQSSLTSSDSIGGEVKGEKVANNLALLWDGRNKPFKYEGVIKDMGVKYCSAV
jgi:hypothetical protein